MSDPPRPTTGSLRLAVFLAGGVVLAGLVGGAAFCAALRCGGRVGVVTVPNFVGETRAEASKRAAAQGLELEVVDQRNDPNVPSGAVLSQDPSAGAEVGAGRRIRVVLSLGSATHRVPDIVGQSARRVEIELRRDGLVPADEARAFD